MTNTAKIRITLKKGGPGSGHHGHSGLPGKHGGSRPGKGGSGSRSGDGLSIGTSVTIYGKRGKVTKLSGSGVAEGSVGVETENGEYYIIRVNSRNLEISGDTPKQSHEVRDGKPVIVYHATQAQFIDSIKETGLRAGRAVNLKEVDRGVFFTTTRDAAEVYASGYEKSAIVEFEIPVTERGKVIFDDYEHKVYGAKHSYIIGRDIPPEWIKAVQFYSDWGEKREKREIIKKQSTAYTVVILE